jgi:origin recognition complex subunit 4
VDIDEADADNDAATPSRRSSRKPVYTAKSTLNKRPHKNGVDEEKDVYDDIEGALPESTRAPRIQSPAPPQTNTPRRRRKKIDLDPSLPHPFKSTPGRSAKNDTGTEGASPTSFRALVNEYRHGVDAGDQDELAVEGATPTKQTKNTRATKETADKSPVKGHLTSGRKPLGRPPRRSAVHEDEAGPTDELHKEGLEGDTPSRRRSGRKPARSAKETKQTVEEINDGDQQGEKEVPSAVTPSRSSTRRALVPDSEDALSNRGLPDATTSKRGRRRANRADHTNNRDDVNGTDNEPEVNEEEVAEEVDEEDVEGLNFDGNSVTGSVLDPTEPSPFNKPPSASKKTDAITVLQGTLASGPELDLLKTILMERLTGKRPVPVVGLDEEYKTVHQLVEHTITAGEGNSMLLIGARGSGKTALVNKVLSEISKDNAEDYHVVRLNGFIHTDDKIALREIWRQLGKEMDIEEDGGLGKNYADTLTTLLALLSHPSEHTGELTDQVAKAVIFVMDEFDLFAMHPRQTLLYNLFDIAQSRKAPIAVLGLTTRIDVANSLEKRVKSRFSHRYVHLSLAKSFTAYQELCKASLVIQPENLNVEERSILCSAPRNPTTTPAKSKKTSKATSQDVLTTWNSNISVSVPHAIINLRTTSLTNIVPLRLQDLPNDAPRPALLPDKIRARRANIPSPSHRYTRPCLHFSFPNQHPPPLPNNPRLQTQPHPRPLLPRPLSPHRRLPPRRHPRRRHMQLQHGIRRVCVPRIQSAHPERCRLGRRRSYKWGCE